MLCKLLCIEMNSCYVLEQHVRVNIHRKPPQELPHLLNGVPLQKERLEHTEYT